MRARRLAAPTGKPVRAVMPTGGSKVDAREVDPDAWPYEPFERSTRKSTVGGARTVTGSIAATVSYTDVYRHERRAALARVTDDRAEGVAAGLGAAPSAGPPEVESAGPPPGQPGAGGPT